MKQIILGLIFLWGFVGLKAQQSSDYGIFMGITHEHRHTILPVPREGSVKPAVGAFYRFNMNPRYALRAGINYGIGDTPEELFFEEGPLQKADVHALFEFNFLPLSPRRDMIKVSTFIATGLSYYKGLMIPFTTGVKYNATEQLTLGAEWDLRYGFRNDPVDPDTGYRIFHIADWHSFFGITVGYKVIRRCRTCPFYETNRNYRK